MERVSFANATSQTSASTMFLAGKDSHMRFGGGADCPSLRGGKVILDGCASLDAVMRWFSEVV